MARSGVLVDFELLAGTKIYKGDDQNPRFMRTENFGKDSTVSARPRAYPDLSGTLKIFSNRKYRSTLNSFHQIQIYVFNII